MGKVHAGLAKHGDVYFSPDQTAGKGQRGKTWQSGSDENIALSCIIEPSMVSLTDRFLLSITVALSCYDLVNYYAKTNTTIKWPNDIYWRDRKAGGILIENSLHGNTWQFAVAGIGLNINQTWFFPGLTNPVSLKQITGKTYDILMLAKELCGFLHNRIETLKVDPLSLLAEYNSHLYKAGEKVLFKIGDMSIESLVKSVNLKGQLLIFNGTERFINWGEVEWVISANS
jgi:BirA family biotin operon repressor/biotin-[acetyl-CoA-carboxylase] ligase